MTRISFCFCCDDICTHTLHGRCRPSLLPRTFGQHEQFVVQLSLVILRRPVEVLFASKYHLNGV